MFRNALRKSQECRGRSGLFSNPKECFERAGSKGFPNFDDFISDDSRKAHRHPKTCCFDGQIEPCPDVQSDQDARAIFPPTIGQSERDFPKQADEKKKKKSEAEGAPVDELLRSVKKTGRWNERSTDEINEIPRESFGLAG
jgi:hypothetical protein